MDENEFPKKAIPLVEVGENNQLSVGREAIEIISKIQKPLAVIGVAGQYRTGKSFLLNRVLLGENDGFQVGSTTNACTKGIWMWGRPLKGTTQDGQQVNVIILDSEGLGSIEEGSNHDSRIFSLVMLICSSFVYNSMGSIDENALDSLSVIVDLTKNIQIKSGNNQDVDYEDFAFYMPSFLWVVRDFSLELKNKEDQKMDSNEYLELALAEVPGFSEQIEQKNKIRKLLRTFFKERSCQTLIRPVLDEEQLRQISKLPDSQLRPEFLKQMTELRTVLFQQLKIKQLDGSPFNGEMLISLLQNYLKSFNDNSIPVIETCWTYICRQQNQRAFEESLNVYEKEMENAFQNLWPVSQKALKNLSKDCQQLSLESFKKQSVSEDSKEVENQLLEELVKKYQIIKNENKMQFEQQFNKMMNELYEKNIIPALKNNEYQSFTEFHRDFKNFEQYFIDLDLEGPNKQQLLSQFLQQKIGESCQFLCSSLEIDCQKNQQLVQTTKQQFEELQKNHNEELEKQKRKDDLLINDLKNNFQQAELKNNQLTEILNKTKQEKEAFESQTIAQIQQIQTENQENLDKKLKIKAEAEEQCKNLQKELLIQKSQFDQQKALLQQQLKFQEERYNQANQSSNKKEEEYKKTLNESIDKVKEIQTQNEQQIRTLTKENERLADTISENIDKMENINKQNNIKIKQAQTKEEQMKQQIDQLEIEKQQLTEKIKSDSQKIAEYQQNQQQGILSNEQKQQVVDLQKLLQETQDQLQSLKKTTIKEKAIQEQKKQFLTQKVEDLQRQLEESKKLYEQTFETFESNVSEERTDLDKQMKEMQEIHQKEMQSIIQQNTLNTNDLNGQLQQLKLEKAELTKKYNELLKETGNQIKNQQSEIQKLTKDLQDQLKITTQLQTDNKLLNSKNQEITTLTKTQIQEMQQKTKEQIENEIKQVILIQTEEKQQINNIHTEEKNRLTQRIKEEKESYQTKITKLQSEYEEKIAQLSQSHEEDVEQLRGELGSLKMQNASYIQNLEQEVAKKGDNIQLLNQQLKLSTSEYEKLKKSIEAKIQLLKETQRKEEQEMAIQIDQLKIQITQKDEEIWKQQQSLDNMKTDLSKTRDQAIQGSLQAQKELDLAKQEAVDQKKQCETLQQQLTESKIEFGKQIALATQSNTFLTHRVEDLLKQLENVQKKIDEKQNELTQQFANEKKQIQFRFDEQIKDLTDKFEQKKKQCKQMETEFNSKKIEFDQIKQQLSDSISNIQQQDQKQIDSLNQTNEQSQIQLQTIAQKYDVQIKSFKEQIQNLNKLKQEVDAKLEETEANYEKDKELFIGKLQFLEEQKEQVKKEKENVQKNLDLMLQKFSKLRSQEKSDSQNNQSILVANLESRYNQQLQDQTNRFNQQLQQLNNKILALEAEIKSLIEKLKIENQQKSEILNLKEQLQQQLIDNEKQYKSQTETLKSLKESKINELTQKLEDFEKKSQEKLQQIEEKKQDIERKKMNAVFEHERDKAKWAAEVDHFSRAKQDFGERISELEKQKQSYLKENEKLKNENKRLKLLGNDNKMQWKMPLFGSKAIEKSCVTDTIQNKSILNHSIINKHIQALNQIKENSSIKCNESSFVKKNDAIPKTEELIGKNEEPQQRQSVQSDIKNSQIISKVEIQKTESQLNDKTDIKSRISDSPDSKQMESELQSPDK